MLKTINMQFKAEVYEFNLKNIDLFITPNFARTKSEHHIKALKNLIKTNDFQVGSAITCVKTNSNKFLIIDGNHRIQAIRDILGSGISEKVYSVIIEYPTMSRDDMREFMQTMGTLNKKMDSNSLFEVYQKDIFIYQNFDKLPVMVSIRPKKGFFRLINLINFLETKDSTKLPIAKSLNSTIERAKSSNQKDLDFLVEYMAFFEEVFGKITSENRYAVPCFMIPLASIFGVNYEKILKNRANSSYRFQMLISDPEILELLRMGGKSRQLLQAFRERQIILLNRKLAKGEELFE